MKKDIKTKKIDKRRPTRESVFQYRDYDYEKDLSEEDKAWLRKFDAEYYRNYSVLRMPSIHPAKYSKQLSNDNYKYRMAVDLSKAKPLLDKYEPLVESFEDAVITKIDLERKHKK